MRLLVAVVVSLLVTEARATPPVLERIEVLGNPASAVRLELSDTAPSPVARTLPPSAEAPDRIYLDLTGTALRPGPPAAADGSGPLLRVRSGQFDATTVRVVLDLAHAVPFAVRATGREIVVELGSQPLAPPAQIGDRRPPASDAVPDVAAAAPARLVTGGPPARPTVPPRPPSATGPEGSRLELSVLPPAPPPAADAPPVATTQPPEPAPPARTARPHPAIAMPLVVLDAGHGGRDPGAEGLGGVLEKDVVLEVTRRLAGRLPERIPVTVLMTRTDDSFIPIERRLAAAPEGALLFLSLHANACSDPGARGLEVFYGGGTVRAAGPAGDSRQAALLGRCLAKALGARVGLVRGSARPGAFGVLVRNPVPSALVEIGYLTHPDEAVRTQDVEYQDLLVDALADGLVEYLHASTPPL